MTAFVPLQIDALVATIDGSFNRVLQIADETKRRGAEIDRERAGLQFGTRAARRALIYLGRADEALAGILDPADLFMNNGVFSAQRALCLAHAGRSEAARDILHRMMSARDMGGLADPTPASVLRYLLETAAILSEVDAAKIIERRMASMATLLFTEADMCYNIGRLCGGAAALQGQAEKARGYYNQALEICQRVRFRPEIALTRLELAELLLKHYPGERAAVVEHLDFAIAEFREMKMQPSLERALRHKDVLKA
jgi:tetratricopeptide (TPR) repeat protein